MIESLAARLLRNTDAAWQDKAIGKLNDLYGFRTQAGILQISISDFVHPRDMQYYDFIRDLEPGIMLFGDQASIRSMGHVEYAVYGIANIGNYDVIRTITEQVFNDRYIDRINQGIDSIYVREAGARHYIGPAWLAQIKHELGLPKECAFFMETAKPIY